MQSIDKGDVNISKLFIWSKKFDILDMKNEVRFSVYMRVIGDADLNIARVAAIRESAKLRKALKTEEDAKLVYFPDFDSMSVEELIQGIGIGSAVPITREAVQAVQIPYPKEPNSDAELEVLEQYQKDIDAYPDVRNNAIRVYVDEQFEILNKRLKEMSREELIKEYEKLLTNDACENSMIKKFKEMCTYLACYKDEGLKHRLFESFEEFDNLPEFYKTQFMDNYQDLEIDTDTLKK